MTVSETIREKRKTAHITQADLAYKVGVSDKTVQRWESGERVPGADDLSRVASALDTSVAYLMGETDDPTIRLLAKLNGTEETSLPEGNSPEYETRAARNLDELVRELAKQNPDLTIQFRDVLQNLNGYDEKVKKSLADGMAYVLGLAELDDLPGLKKEGKHGKI